MTTTTEITLINQLRTVLDLTHTEIQVAETRVAQARTEAVRNELTQNANNGRIRAEAIEKAIRDLGGFPDTIGPFLGRAAAAVKALTEQAQPFDEALLGDLALEDQLLDRSRYIKALAVAAKNTDVQGLADRLITAHIGHGQLADHRAGRGRPRRAGGAAPDTAAGRGGYSREDREPSRAVVGAIGRAGRRTASFHRPGRR